MKEPAKPPKPTSVNSAVDAKPPRVLEFDPVRFVHHLESWDASFEEKAAYLEVVWQIVVQFVDLGYGIHPLSTAQQSCGQVSETPSGHDSHVSDMVEWRQSFNRKTKMNARRECAEEREEA